MKEGSSILQIGITRLAISLTLNTCMSYDPSPETTVLELDGYAATLVRFRDGEKAQTIELSGEEVAAFIAAYRAHRRRYERDLSRIVATSFE